MTELQSENNGNLKSKKEFWITVSLFHIYFIFFYMLVLIIFSRFTVSWLLLTVPFLIIAMVPLAKKGITAQKEKPAKNDMLPTVGFLILFAAAKLIIIFSLHDYFEPFYMIDLESSAINLVVVGIFTVVLALAIFFLFTSDSWINRFIFIILGVYSLARILSPFGVMSEITDWVLQYLTLIALPIILLAIFIKAKSSRDSG
ncbi:hypothetical protein [Lacicoccus qingdaonensis]|uniref:Uncharacterized protein n=1 Tax=Lacicoccus qingdaonensis TaxID=576118 RepID=A0A1G9D0G1_9BACL|nr:hypothetical protein [Salinicoccus qingdaonensis]SDK57410.1 hypothetical protein SAMN05216216_1054 [Salinicoccus qingdaonensis]